MTDPIAFDSTTPRFALPLLYTAQTRKETFVNEAFVRTDVLLHCAIGGESVSPPKNPTDGDTWIVASKASGDWAGNDGMLASYQSGGWTFITPRDGMRVFDRSTGQDRLFSGSWRKASPPTEPVGGSTVDGEARAAIANLVASLQAVGILPSV
ncbi:uncharacterized protein DUF2793 [Novosphingobium sp. PhB165]|uniref:DUF2793 domain-containing protein n=1 Tax=Novosphingobium sp. PhB165 TaxID=2485105 RepID=UPI001042BF87|nr:DUF2793 domain-containing protein [Novosphingobium sp. PhB165]TCM16951.1 uncharacterized protein DUF2793 [Novosphingobium sp. PhB165]